MSSHTHARRAVVSAGGLRRAPAAIIFVALLCIALLAPRAARAEATSPQWAITSVSGPASFKAGDSADQYTVTATNTGSAPTDGSTILIADALPQGVTASAIAGTDSFSFGGDALTCELSSVSCETNEAVDAGESLIVTITVAVAASPGDSLIDSPTVSGGGASVALTQHTTPVGASPIAFGIAPESLVASLSTRQAGAHPNFTTAFALAQEAVNTPAGSPKELSFELPPGLVGNPTATPRCTVDGVLHNTCPEDTMVGLATISLTFGSGILPVGGIPVYNIIPSAHEPAAFAFNAFLFPVRLDTSVRSDGDYGVRVSAHDISEARPFTSTSVTLWGVPGEHNGPGPFTNALGQSYGGAGSPLAPFMTNPTVCGNALPVTLSISSWAQPAIPSTATTTLPALTGCDALSFTPSISVSSDNHQAGEPAGYEVDLRVPQQTSLSAYATPELQSSVVTLPQGTIVSPSAADGLGACSPLAVGIGSLAPGGCPPASQIASVEVITPLLSKPLLGHVYLAEQGNNPFDSLLALYLVAEGSGVTVKLAGEVHADPTTGQLTASFTEEPQLPFSELKLRFKGGSRAPLANPDTCGEAITTTRLTPYGGGETATPSSALSIEGCQAPRFNPIFAAGMTGTSQAGRFSPLAVRFSRSDLDQNLAGIQVQTPPGLLGMISHVTPCPEPNASAGSCGAESLIGHASVSAGPGPAPFFLREAGAVYLTGPYDGGPFGLSVVVHAKAGPIDLGNVIVRAAITIDPHTAQITITSGAFPSILEGIPLQVRSIEVTIDRPEFIFNPTNCEPLSINGSIASVQGGRAPVSSPFQTSDCARLQFKPNFSASTQGHTSRSAGASLQVKIAYPQTADQANIRRVAVQLPNALATRLTTLHQACTAAKYEHNPAECPAGAFVGTATAHTPILQAPLSGPVILVSHGGAKLPDLVMMLEADERGGKIRLDLVGNTQVKGATVYTHFDAVPDAPISSFALNLPEGPHSALTSSTLTSLCGQSLVLPLSIEGQNGALVKQRPKVAVTGCKASHQMHQAKKKKRKKS
jgi:hypothetical protein